MWSNMRFCWKLFGIFGNILCVFVMWFVWRFVCSLLRSVVGYGGVGFSDNLLVFVIYVKLLFF